MPEYPKIVVTPPGPKAREILRRDEPTLSPSTHHAYPLVADSAQGCIVRDVDGNEYIDFNSGLGVMNVGHSHPRVVEAVRGQTMRLLHASGAYHQAVVGRLSRDLSKITPGSFEKRFFYSSSGAEAVEAGIKLAAWHTRSRHFLAFVGASHGRTLGALSLTAVNPTQRRHFPTALPVSRVPYPYCYRCAFGQTHPDCGYQCVDFIEEQLLKRHVPPEEVAAIAFEPVQSEAGCVVPPPEYFRRLKRLADRHDLLLMDDEAWTGVGRTGRWFAVENWGVEPDILCVGGSLSSGLPLGVTAARAEVMDWEPDSHASILGGNPVACKVALEVIDVVREEHLLENAARQGNYALRRLREMMEKYRIIGDVRGKGLLIGVELVRDRKTKEPASGEAREVVLRSWRRGVTSLLAGASTVLLSPPLTISRDLLDRGLDILESAVSEVTPKD